ncbi:MAG: hypothetical protein RLY20_666 [Verrucomicrobiota bacterium]
MQTSKQPKLSSLLARGWRKKCPCCGAGPLYKRWLTLHERCSHCGLQYLANQGDLFGPLVFFDRILFLIPFITVFYFRLWHPSLIFYLLAGGLMLYLLIFTMPNRNGMSVAFDYYLRLRNGEITSNAPAPDKEP